MRINKSSNTWKLHQEKCRNVLYITGILFQFHNFNWIMNNLIKNKYEKNIQEPSQIFLHIQDVKKSPRFQDYSQKE